MRHYDIQRFSKRLLFVLITFHITSGNAQNQTNEIREPSYEVSVEYVTVPFHAVDSNGQSVLDLTIDQIQLFEEGKLQKIQCFETPESSTAAINQDDSTSSTAIHSRDLGLFLDLYNISPQEWKTVKPELQHFLKQLPGRWDTMVAAYTANQKLGVAGPFHGRPADLVSSLEKVSPNARRDERLNRQMREFNRILDGILANKNARLASEDVALLVDSSIVDFTREQRGWSESSLSAVKKFSEYVKEKFPKSERTLVYVSGGFNISPGKMFLDKLDRVLHTSGMEPTYHPISGLPQYGDLPHRRKTDEGIKEAIEAFASSNVTVYSVNTRGTQVGSIAGGMNPEVARDDTDVWKDFQEGMSLIADKTGGTTFQNSRNFADAFNVVLDDISYSYLLCYQKPDHDKAGKYHHIKLKSMKKGVKLRYREGYSD